MSPGRFSRWGLLCVLFGLPASFGFPRGMPFDFSKESTFRWIGKRGKGLTARDFSLRPAKSRGNLSVRERQRRAQRSDK